MLQGERSVEDCDFKLGKIMNTKRQNIDCIPYSCCTTALATWKVNRLNGGACRELVELTILHVCVHYDGVN